MKTMFGITFLAAFAAFFLLPVGFLTAGSVLFAAGFAAIVATDYARQRRPRPGAAALALAPARKERFGLAA